VNGDGRESGVHLVHDGDRQIDVNPNGPSARFADGERVRQKDLLNSVKGRGEGIPETSLPRP
jgi:hypothetical protein